MTVKDPIFIVEQAVHRTRNNAIQQVAMGAIGATLMAVAWGFATWVVALLALNVLIVFFVGRRLLRLRRKGPAVQALLYKPERVKEIASWPRKPPPNRMPVFLDIFTHDGATCSLLLDPKKPQDTANLLGALHSRSPDALLSIPKLPVDANLA